MYQEGALCLTFSGFSSSLSRLSSPGEKEGKKAQGRKRKNETKASNCQIWDNAKFRHYYPGYSGNHFTRLRRHLGLKSDIFIKPLTSRFAKAIALSLNFPCVGYWNIDLERLPLNTPSPPWISSGTARHHPRHLFLGIRVAQPTPHRVPWLLQQLVLLLLPPAHGHCCCQHKIPVEQGSQSPPALWSWIGLFRVWCFPQPSLASPAPALEFTIWLQPGAKHHDPSPSGPGCRLFFLCSFQHKKNHCFFFSTLLEENQEAGQEFFYVLGGLFAFLQEDKGWHEATGLFPQVLLHEMDILEKRQSTAGGLNWRGCRAAVWVGVCGSVGLTSATSSSAFPHLHQQEIQAQPQHSALLAFKHSSLCPLSRWTLQQIGNLHWNYCCDKINLIQLQKHWQRERWQGVFPKLICLKTTSNHQASSNYPEKMERR